ncbi:alpha-L-fucosidase [Aliifodinibius sp. S!AR15-10]|uniref:alpha-L-fucosidase n=1 Tax=Aliifodinibius sp. S!AR15-10 TaxID=2950437 RepID=UPI00286418DA|nr:alpha-L-fucosidase [Aliifodinibius sp. S!AR15-10]MDR8392125.1 alpha-L-fucosidase [Aliifodinibius sp. S!AR15-10]
MKNLYFDYIIILAFSLFLSTELHAQQAMAPAGIQRDATHPTPEQVEYQRQEKIAFVHFGVNTYTNREWGTGDESPSIFNPKKFDADQWARVLSENGFQTLVLTAKHHDGFALWPSDYTEHDVGSSPWKNGNGDIVKEVAEACEKYGIKFGVYLSPWDMHESSYGTPEYNDFYLNQLEELLTNYGPIAEIWFDGAKGEGAKDMEYDFDAWWNMVRKLQPNAVIFSDEGPDVRWIGNEHGYAGETNWSTINRDSVSIGKPGQGQYLNRGEPQGPDWVPGECNTSIRPGWFYHQEEDDQVKPISDLMEIYYKSIGRNCTMMINIPPTPGGRFHANDVERLNEFTERVEAIFDDNLAAGRSVTGSGSDHSALTDGEWDTFWVADRGARSSTLTLTLAQPTRFNHIVLQEYIPLGQRIAEFKVLAKEENQWTQITEGTTIGHKRILKVEPVMTDQVRIVIEKSYGQAALNEIGIYNGE